MIIITVDSHEPCIFVTDDVIMPGLQKSCYIQLLLIIVHVCFVKHIQFEYYDKYGKRQVSVVVTVIKTEIFRD